MRSVIKINNFGTFVVSAIAAAMLAGCAGAATGYAPAAPAPVAHESGLTALSSQRLAALTVPRYEQRPVHPDRRASWIRPDWLISNLLYVGDWGTNDVYVYDFPSGAEVGTLTGFDEPYGMCVDKKGDVYIANFGSGDIVEYAHGGEMPIKTFTVKGYVIGCSVDRQGDLAAGEFYSSSGAGEICIFYKGSSQNEVCYSASSSCYYAWSPGYDDKGNLIWEGEYSKITVCALLAGSKKVVTLKLKGATIDFPGGTMWDGKYIALADQEFGGKYQTGIYQTTLHGKTLTVEGSTVFTDDCYSDYADIVAPFVLGKANTPANRRQGTLAIGPNLWCYDAGSPRVGVWYYPSGEPDFYISASLEEPYGSIVSIGKKCKKCKMSGEREYP